MFYHKKKISLKIVRNVGKTDFVGGSLSAVKLLTTKLSAAKLSPSKLPCGETVLGETADRDISGHCTWAGILVRK